MCVNDPFLPHASQISARVGVQTCVMKVNVDLIFLYPRSSAKRGRGDSFKTPTKTNKRVRNYHYVYFARKVIPE